MRSYKNPEEFFDSMKKKPELQNILNNLSMYTHNDIERTTTQPKWIRDILKKKRNDIEKYNMVMNYKDKIQTSYDNQEKFKDNTKYDVYKFIHNTSINIKPINSRLEMVIDPGDMFLVMKNDKNCIEVKINYVLLYLSFEDVENLKKISRYIDNMTTEQYGLFLNEHIKEKSP